MSDASDINDAYYAIFYLYIKDEVFRVTFQSIAAVIGTYYLNKYTKNSQIKSRNTII